MATWKRLRIVIFILGQLIIGASFATTNCGSHDDCLDEKYCHESGICVKCVDCSVLKRKSGIDKCPKIFAHCGDCLQGYQQVQYLDKIEYVKDESKTTCILEMEIAKLQSHDPDEFHFSWLIAAIFIISIMGGVSFYSYYCRNNTNVASDPPQTWLELGNLTPPPNYDDCCNANNNPDEMEPFVHHLNISERAESKTNAVPFIAPLPDNIELEGDETSTTGHSTDNPPPAGYYVKENSSSSDQEPSNKRRRTSENEQNSNASSSTSNNYNGNNNIHVNFIFTYEGFNH